MGGFAQVPRRERRRDSVSGNNCYREVNSYKEQLEIKEIYKGHETIHCRLKTVISDNCDSVVKITLIIHLE